MEPVNETSNVLPLPAMECLGGGENWSAYGHSDEAMLAYAAAREKVAVSAAIKKFGAELPKLLEETYMEGARESKAALEMAVEMLGEKVAALELDARRFQWLTEDHADLYTRTACRDILRRMPVITYYAASTAIDLAIDGKYIIGGSAKKGGAA